MQVLDEFHEIPGLLITAEKTRLSKLRLGETARQFSAEI